MARILIIEDEPDLQEVLSYNLGRAGYEVVQALRGSEGLDRARKKPPDLILLDLMLPDTPGSDVCRALKSDPSTRSIPVVMLTAKGEEIDRVVGFELGAEDYVVKPFSVRELLLRIQALLKRLSGGGAREPPPGRFGRLRVDAAGHRVWVDDRETRLTALEFRLLTVLMGRKGRVLDRTALLEEVWEITADVTTRTVDTHVKRLREKLRRAGSYIETVRGVGYRFAESPPRGEG